MLYECIKCNCQWETDDPSKDDFISHGLCKRCLRELLIPTYRKRQREELGAWECFGTAKDYCDQECKYKDLCLECKIK